MRKRLALSKVISAIGRAWPDAKRRILSGDVNIRGFTGGCNLLRVGRRSGRPSLRVCSFCCVWLVMRGFIPLFALFPSLPRGVPRRGAAHRLRRGSARETKNAMHDQTALWRGSHTQHVICATQLTICMNVFSCLRLNAIHHIIVQRCSNCYCVCGCFTYAGREGVPPFSPAAANAARHFRFLVVNIQCDEWKRKSFERYL